MAAQESRVAVLADRLIENLRAGIETAIAGGELSGVDRVGFPHDLEVGALTNEVEALKSEIWDRLTLLGRCQLELSLAQ